MAAPSIALVAFAECFSGGVGGWFSSWFLFPLDVIKTRMQGGEEGSALQIAGRLYKKGGAALLWRGGHARGLQSMIEKIGYFYSYSLMKSLIERSGPMGIAMQLTVGYFVRRVARAAHPPSLSPADLCLSPRPSLPPSALTHSRCTRPHRPTGCICRCRCLLTPLSFA